MQAAVAIIAPRLEALIGTDLWAMDARDMELWVRDLRRQAGAGAVGFEPAMASGPFVQDAVLMADRSFLPSRTNSNGTKTGSHGGGRGDSPRRYTDAPARLGQRSVYGYLANIAAIDTAIVDPLVVATGGVGYAAPHE